MEDSFLANEDFVADIYGRITDENPIGILKIDGDRVPVEKSGEFSHRLFVIEFEGQVEIVAIDKFGNRSARTIVLEH